MYGVNVFLQYQIKQEFDDIYQEAMQPVATLLRELEAKHIDWYLLSPSTRTYHESFYVPTESHFYAIKKLRNAKYHNVFDQIVKGGVNGIQWIALKRI
jgi:hypothetical protein